MVCEQCNATQTETRFCSFCGKPCAPCTWNRSRVQLSRPLAGRRVAGVCAGIAQAYGLDVSLVRVIAVLLVLAGFGSTVVFYIAAWIAMPNEASAFTPPAMYGGRANGSPATA